jgi:hypothetical protein
MLTRERNKELFTCKYFWAGGQQARLLNIAHPSSHDNSLDYYIPRGGVILDKITHALWGGQSSPRNSKSVLD